MGEFLACSEMWSLGLGRMREGGEQLMGLGKQVRPGGGHNKKDFGSYCVKGSH